MRVIIGLLVILVGALSCRQEQVFTITSNGRQVKIKSRHYSSYEPIRSGISYEYDSTYTPKEDYPDMNSEIVTEILSVFDAVLQDGDARHTDWVLIQARTADKERYVFLEFHKSGSTWVNYGSKSIGMAPATKRAR